MNSAEVFSIIRSQRPKDIEEWAKYYLAIGFDKITILDNESTFSIRELLAKYKQIEIKNIIIGDTIDKEIPRMFEIACKEKESENNFVAFIDDDEFIYIKNNKKIKDILNDEIEVLCFFWKYLSSREILKDREGTMIDTFNYTTDFVPPYNNNNRMHLKSIINFNRCKGAVWNTDGPHLPFLKNNVMKTITGKRVINGEGNAQLTNDFYDNQEAYIYHYAFQSFRDFVFKLERRPLAGSNFNISSFESFNRPGNYSVLDNNMTEKKKELGI
jgi:hypothetical protein